MLTKEELKKIEHWMNAHCNSEYKTIASILSECGLIEHEPTAKEKYEQTKKYSGFVFKNIPGEWFSIEVVNDIFNLADSAIAEAEEGARK